MIIIRYFFWLLVYQLVTFYKMNPWEFFKGMVYWPFLLVSRFLAPPQHHKYLVAGGIEGLKHYWSLEGSIPAPSFIVRRLDALELEVRS